MLRLLARRATAQFPLLAAVLAVVVIGATLLGVGALLLSASQERGLSEAITRATPAEVDVTAFTTEIKGQDARSVADDARAVVTGALAPFPVTTAIRASSAMRRLGSDGERQPRVGYLSGIEGLSDRAQLVEGRWPAPGRSPTETVVLESTARRLDLAPGSRVELGPQVHARDPADTVRVRVVGVIRPRPDAGWDRDPLAAAGYDPAFLTGGAKPALAYGPFVVDLADLFAGGSTISRLQVNAHPDLSAPTSGELDEAALALAGAGGRLRAALGDRVQIQRLASELPATLGVAHVQQSVTRAAVLVVMLLGTALTAVALGLSGRLIAALRMDETALLSRLGAGRGQLAAIAATEALALAAVAGTLALPLSSFAHTGLTHLPVLAGAGLATGPQVTAAQVVAVLAGALLLAAVIVGPSLRPDPAQTRPTRGRLGLLTRSGADLALAGLAVAGWWQLRDQPATATGVDAVRVVAPALCLLAAAAVALRALAPPLRAGEWLARRSRGLVLPLAAFEAARRPRAVAAGLLLAMAAAAGSFGLAFSATWERSQHDQADTQVGTDLALDLTTPPVAGQGAQVAAATGGVVAAVADRGISIGQYVAGTGAPPRLVAVDATRATDLLRGRLPAGTSWAQVGGALASGPAVTGVALPPGDDPVLTLTGTSSEPGTQLRAVPRLVLQDPAGLRTPCDGATVPLDGHPHPLQLCGTPADGSRVVAVDLKVDMDFGTLSEYPPTGATEFTIALRVPHPAGATAGPPAPWSATSVGTDPSRITAPTAAVHRTGKGTDVLTTGGVVGLEQLAYQPVELVATAFAPPAAVPVAVSSRLSEALGVSTGRKLAVTVGVTPLIVVINRVVPEVPSAPGEVALLADVDTLSRAMITTGDLAPATNAWWVGRPEPDAAARAGALSLGAVVTRAEVTAQFTRGPLRVGLPAALIVLVPAAILLVLAGTIMHVTSDVEARAVEMARLRGLGVPRRSVLGGLLAQHGGMLTLLIGLGTAVGALASWALGPALIRSDLGGEPVPVVAVLWPWPAETALSAVLLLGGLTCVVTVIAVQLSRADAAHLRAGS